MKGKSAIVSGLFLLASAASTHAIPTNGDFSAGLTGWTVGGNVQVIDGAAVFFEVVPPESSRIYQDLIIPAGAMTLSFDYLFITSGQFSEHAFPDAFSVRLLNPVTLDPILPTPGRNDFFYHDAVGAPDSIEFDPSQVTRQPLADPVRPDWFVVALDISSLSAGTNARLQFDLFGGDNGQETFAAVDNVSLTRGEQPAIPEPFSVVLASVALAALGRRARSREHNVAIL